MSVPKLMIDDDVSSAGQSQLCYEFIPNGWNTFSGT